MNKNVNEKFTKWFYNEENLLVALLVNNQYNTEANSNQKIYLYVYNVPMAFNSLQLNNASHMLGNIVFKAAKDSSCFEVLINSGHDERLNVFVKSIKELSKEITLIPYTMIYDKNALLAEYLVKKKVPDFSKFKISLNKNLPIPIHLKKIFFPTDESHNEKKAVGTISCDCLHNEFIVKTPIIDNVPDGSIVKIQCKHCNQEYLAFDSSKHGWNGFVCHFPSNSEEININEWHCSKCDSNFFKVFITILSQGKEDFVRQTGIKDGNKEFSKNDWINAFEWIKIDLICCNCGNIEKNWVDYETM